MASFPSMYTEGNRVYWKIPDCLPGDNEIIKKEFFMHNKTWEFVTSFYESGGFLSFAVGPTSPCLCCSLKVRGGIIGDFEKEIFSEDAMDTISSVEMNLSKYQFALSKFQLPEFIHRSRIDFYMKRFKVLHIFIELKQVNHVVPESIKADKLGKRKIEEDYENLLLSGTDSDLTIEVKYKKFKCHRGILRVRSPVFYAMLEHDMKEKASGVVKIIDADPTTFQEFLLYLYTGNSDRLNWENVTELYKLGDKYTVEDLKSLCVEQIKRNISTENFCKFFLLSHQCSDLELTEYTTQFFLKNLKEIICNENWLTFLSENPAESNVLIKALAACVKKNYT